MALLNSWTIDARQGADETRATLEEAALSRQREIVHEYLVETDGTSVYVEPPAVTKRKEPNPSLHSYVRPRFFWKRKRGRQPDWGVESVNHGIYAKR